MKAPSLFQRALVVAIATFLLLLSGSMALAAANDYRARDVIPLGVKIAGVEVGGLSRAEARRAIAEKIEVPLQRPMQVIADGRTWTFDPRGAVSVDAEGMLDEALAPRQKAPFVTRLTYDVARAEAPADIKPRFTVEPATLASWIATIAASVDRPAVDASVTVNGNLVEVIPSDTGRRLDTAGAREALAKAFSASEALSCDARRVELPVEQLQPLVTEQDLGKTIVVDLSERRVRLFAGAKLESEYRCAIGTPAHPTPTGQFKIVDKRFMPTWSNPGSAWAKNMPKSIPAGPGNPLGTRALNLDASGIRIHGTTKIHSIGTAASHGCMRMVRRDIEDLYPRVPVGTKVFIVR